MRNDATVPPCGSLLKMVQAENAIKTLISAGLLNIQTSPLQFVSPPAEEKRSTHRYSQDLR